jgi:hypothetical protein
LARLASTVDEREAASQALATVHPASTDYIENNAALAPMIGRPGWQSLVQPFVGRGYNESRFSDGTYGVYYSADTMETARREVLYHRTRLFRKHGTRPTSVTLNCHAADLRGRLHDIRGLRSKLPEIYDSGDPPEAYRVSQPFGRSLYDQRSNGLAYDSVRHGGGHCVGVFRPVPILHSSRLHARICADWDGHDFAETTTQLLDASERAPRS